MQKQESRLERWTREDSELEALGRWGHDADRLSVPVWFGERCPGECEEEVAAIYERASEMPYGPGVRYALRQLRLLYTHYEEKPLPRGEKPWQKLTKREVHERRAMVAGCLSTLRDGEWEAIRDSFQWQCVYCEKKRLLTLDHVVPLSRGGANSADNIVAACRPCNSSKSSIELCAWLERKGYDWTRVNDRIVAAKARRDCAQRAVA